MRGARPTGSLLMLEIDMRFGLAVPRSAIESTSERGTPLVVGGGGTVTLRAPRAPLCFAVDGVAVAGVVGVVIQSLLAQDVSLSQSTVFGHRLTPVLCKRRRNRKDCRISRTRSDSSDIFSFALIHATSAPFAIR